MKKHSLLAALFLSVAAFAQGIKFEEATFKDILAKAKAENKMVFVDAYAVWCGPCKQMANQVFPKESVGNYFNAHFVNAKIDMEKGEGKDIAKKYSVLAFPTYLFLNGDGEEIHRSVGYFEADDFIKIAQDANNPEKQNSYLKKKFEQGEREPAFLMHLAKENLYGDKDFLERVILAYFETKKETTFTKEEIDLLMSAISSTSDKAYYIYANNKRAIESVVTPDVYNKFDESLKIQTVLKQTLDRKVKTFNEPLFLEKAIPLIGQEKAQNTAQRIQMNLALSNKDFATYEKMALIYYTKEINQASNALNDAAWNFYQNVNNRKSLKKAIEWAKMSVEKSPNYANTDTLAHLYYKIGDKKNAKLWAEKAIEIAKSKGQDGGDTLKLLDKLKS